MDSSAAASVAVVDTDTPVTNDAPRVLAQWETADTRSHAEVLAPAVESVLAAADLQATDLDGVLVGTGPGPFTGLRAGLATARTLGYAWKLPVYGMCSLEAIAHDVAVLPTAARPAEFVVATDARRREVYWAVYRTTQRDAESGNPVGKYLMGGARATVVQGPSVGPAADLPALPVYGRGAGLYTEELAGAVLAPIPGARLAAPPTQWQPTAASLGLAAGDVVNSGGVLSTNTTPLYLRESDAKVPGPRKKATS
ncbi:tRNA (adenosine(37)-N6)-threonylcarbamoyltransferase complex dimerization subunit type 1 TsaB [Kocuria sp.]|uniref:tRNA (adenosine(37)-N6)-threonylcarbamoyltransferase complex dimerization subunit type 1 TsaB n=1 Tax=Kocuria sp. TaxID=1871328 RepID=UPI0026DFC2E6|nr:tRNA (adenosine(37)-N6)-threonylcarbamoyltransferase complex dimerization subunit type 1 TsaB [Kocuria sp.]MDO5617339.1 tRNA (adenosine(37)-N6)-threonylcarbamoyltransferase complex dimerization subunit type 1 TsaB [Kocuria sp.]